MPAFTIPMMFFACLQWMPDQDVLSNFRFEQCVTVLASDRQLTVDHVEWLIPRFQYVIMVHNGNMDLGTGISLEHIR